jgi:NADPH:quinone reductase-like Zn-dependent oxidoreductase
MSQLMLRSIGDADETVYLEPNPDLTVGADQVLIEMEAATINLTDFRMAAGTYSTGVPLDLPAPMGTEGVGRVVEAGPGVDQAIVGRRVVILPTYLQGSWADRLVAPVRSVVVVGESGHAYQLAMLPMNPPTAHLALNRYVTLKPGDWVGQNLGNSAVGQYVIALARHAGLRTLTIVRREQAARELRAMGADIVLVDGDGLRERIADALGTDRLRRVLDGAGGATAVDLAHSLEFRGQVVSYSSLTGTPVGVPAAALVYRELQVRGFWLVNWLRAAQRADIEATYAELAELVEQDVIHAAVEATYPLDEYRAAFAHARTSARSGKVLFTFPGTAS